MTTDKSRADALTDRQRRIMDEAANGPHLRPVAWAVYNGWSRICFYMTEEDARDHAQKAQKNHDLSGSLAAFRVVPLYAAPQPEQADAPAEARQLDAIRYVHSDSRRTGWIDYLPPRHTEMLNEGFRVEYAYIGSAPADAGEARLTDEPSLTNPLTPYGMLVRALRIVTGTVLGDMAQHLGCSPAALSAVEFGRKPLTAAMVADTAAYFASVGIPDTLHALSAAWRAHALVDGADHAA
ncbi:hypothetical protein KTE58_23670 [Burkholderia multivorans]|uniref:hypothetical protein n=1 Tax=Burkholderia multivorans TaxID=87883 RepID=UPI001C27E1B5|nr:hypothetical protein [Burkholderia multivorans]MBU9539388.1 hypothetical protein [Burkholderia multivorans]